MALPVWPGSVPYVPRFDPFSVAQPFAPPLSNQTEDGPPMMRRWASSNWAKMKYEIAITRSQSDALYVFLRDTLGHGSSRFTMPVARRGSSPTSKTCYITSGSIQGPDPYGDNHFIWKFELNVQDY